MKYILVEMPNEVEPARVEIIVEDLRDYLAMEAGVEATVKFGELYTSL